MTREEAYNRIDAIIAKHEIDDDYVTITSILDYDALRMARKALEQEPCNDCISRQAAIDAIRKDIMGGLNYEGILTRLPSVKPQEPKTGEWIGDAKTYYEELNKRGLGVDEYTPYFTDDIACSECLAKYSILDNETQFFKYCPNCGAKMIEEE